MFNTSTYCRDSLATYPVQLLKNVIYTARVKMRRKGDRFFNKRNVRCRKKYILHLEFNRISMDMTLIIIIIITAEFYDLNFPSLSSCSDCTNAWIIHYKLSFFRWPTSSVELRRSVVSREGRKMLFKNIFLFSFSLIRVCSLKTVLSFTNSLVFKTTTECLTWEPCSCFPRMLLFSM